MMNRRRFLAQSLFGLTTLTALGMSSQVMSAPFFFEEGVHYKLLPETARSVQSKGKVQEFFFYGCSHCMDMESPLHQWIDKSPSGVTLEQVPAVFQNPAWSFLARAHYALKQANQLTEKTHQACFELFVVERAKPKTQQELAELIAQKVPQFDVSAFVTATTKEETSEALTRAAQLSGLYQLEAVPSFVINGKYLTDLTMAGSHTKLFALIEQLAQQ